MLFNAIKNLKNIITNTSILNVNQIGDGRDLGFSFANGIFFATGDKVGYRSTDGVNWTQFSLPWSTRVGINGIITERQGMYRDVIYVNGRYVAVAPSTSSYYTESSYTAAYSSDGTNWTGVIIPNSARTIQGYPGPDWANLTYDGSKFLTIGNRSGFTANIASYSSDGITWTNYTLPSTVAVGSLMFGGNKFLSKSGGSTSTVYTPAKISYSTNGTSWSNANFTEPDSGGYYFGRSIQYGNGRFIIPNVPYVAYSDDGINWFFAKDVLPSNNCLFVPDIQKFVCLGTDNIIYVSTDAINWIDSGNYEIKPSVSLSLIVSGNNKLLGQRRTAVVNGAWWYNLIGVLDVSNF